MDSADLAAVVSGQGVRERIWAAISSQFTADQLTEIGWPLPEEHISMELSAMDMAFLCGIGRDQRRFEEDCPELDTEVVGVTTMLLHLSAE